MKKTVIAPDKRLEICELYRGGSTLEAISQQTRIYVHTVTKIVGEDMTEEERAEIAKRNHAVRLHPKEKMRIKFGETFAIAYCRGW